MDGFAWWGHTPAIRKVTLDAKTHRKILQAKLGLWLFFISQTMLFVSLIVAKGMLLGPGQPINLSIVGPAIMTVLLIFGSITVQLGENAVANDRQVLLQQMLGATMLLGLGFIAGLIWVWSTLPFDFSEPWGVVFFTMTGLHVLHVIIGELFLLRVMFKARAAAYTPANYWGVQGAARFWHFLGVIWLLYFSVLYIF